MWRKRSTIASPAVPAFGQPKPPPTIPFKKQNDRSLPATKPEQPEPAPVHDPAPIDRRTPDSSEIDLEVLSWIKENPDAVQKLYYFINK